MRFATVVAPLLLLVPTSASAQTAVVAGAAAAVTAEKAVSTCVRHPILCGAAAVVGIAVAKSAARDPSTLTTARQQEAAGQKITPPGYCPDETYSWLNAAVDRLCKEGTIDKCVPSDSKLRLTAKAIAFSSCAKARARREDTCFRGGNTGHRQQIEELWNGHDNCQTMAGLK